MTAEWFDTFKQNAESANPGLDLWIHREACGFVQLSRIVLPKDQRGKGTGSIVLRELTALADKYGEILTCSPEPFPSQGGSKTALTRWYRRHGFKPNKGRSKDFRTMTAMLRKPQVPTD